MNEYHSGTLGRIFIRWELLGEYGCSLRAGHGRKRLSSNVASAVVNGIACIQAALRISSLRRDRLGGDRTKP
ncbi:hypothetical protein [Paenibacillus sp. FSL W8-0194]|uniref:hypothetical protein n=1 Tax=Paenibacillus sp. FSL W8-0194 TaxID=2921711 RepID=UPI0030D7D1F8